MNLACPHCSSFNTIFKDRVKLWECQNCDERFKDPATKRVDPQTIFLSYAHKSERDEDYDISEDLVLLVKAALEQDGHTVWIDKEGIRGGHNWRENITRAILSHDHFLSFLSKRSVRDPGVCLNEIAIALDKGVNFQTVLTEPEEIVKPPITVTDTQWHHFVGWQEARSQDQATWDAWFSERMNGIRAQIEDVKNARAPGELTILRRALEPKTFHADIAKKTEGFFGRKWLFEAFDQWLDKTNDQIFWLQGSPGIGKSAFAAKLVHQSNSRIMGFFKCDFQALKSPEESAKEVICTLAYQLATRMPDYRSKLLYGQGVNDPEVVLKKTADDLFRFLITEPLNKQGKIVEGQRSAIVIDALDEAGRNDGTNPLLTLIKKHAPNLPDWLGIVITSRPEGYIVQELADIKAQSVSGDTTQNTQDLKDYLEKRIDPKITVDQRAKVIDQIIAKSDGAFLYISQIIKDKYDLTKPELLPDGMNGYFMENFSRYFKDAKEYGKETEPFLELMVAAPGPLPRAMAQELLGWTDREVTIQVTEPMGSLLQEKDGGLIFFHKSLSEWLKDSKKSGRYHVNSGGAERLGNFLWREYKSIPPIEVGITDRAKKRNKKDSEVLINRWVDKIQLWLVVLMPNLPIWHNLGELKNFQVYLERNLLYTNWIIVEERCLNLLTEEFGESSKEVVFSINNLSHKLSILARYEHAEQMQRKALDIGQEVFGLEHSVVSTILNNLASTLDEKGQFEEAEILYLRALAICEKIFGLDHPETALILNNLAGLFFKISDFEQAEPLFHRALAIREKILGPEHPETAMSCNNLASLIESRAGDYDRAEPLYRRALAIREKILGPEHPETALILDNLASNLESKGQYDEAETYYRRALSIREKIFGLEHPATGATLNNLAYLLNIKCNYVDAEVFYRGALSIYSKVFGSDHPHTATVMSNIANLLEAKGDYDVAESLYRRALSIREKILGREHIEIAASLQSIASILNRKGDYDATEQLCRRAISIREKLLGSSHPYVSGIITVLAQCLASKGEFEEAKLLYRRALDICEKTLGAKHPETATALNNLAKFLYNNGDYEEAESLNRMAFRIYEAIFDSDHPYVLGSKEDLDQCIKQNRKSRDTSS